MRPVGAFIAAAAVFLVFLPTLGNELVYWDDNFILTENTPLKSLDWTLVKWAFTSNVLFSWIPLTLISFAVDYAVWGPEPWGFHLTNNILHSVNTFIVFFVVYRLVVLARPEVERSGPNEKALGAAFVTALLFGLHPMRVESVAWATERKDVLYAMSYLLSVLAYIGYALKNSKKVWRYAGVVALFACSLMSKPMAVSLPMVLLLLDYYPLKRLGPGQPGRPGRPGRWKGAGRLVVEKVPLIAMSLYATLATVEANVSGGSFVGRNSLKLLQFESVLLGVRNYLFHLYKTLLPTDLALIYPRPDNISLFSVEFSSYLVIFTVITLFAVRSLKKHAAFSAAWFYYIITLLPVIPALSPADRFTYLPCLGPFILVGILASRAALAGGAGRRRRMVASGLVLVTAVLLSALSVKQIGVWKDSMTLWTHQVTLYPENASLAHNNRGNARYRAGDFSGAIKDYTKAIELKKDHDFANAYYNRANTLARLGEFKEAVKDYTSAIRFDPASAKAYLNRGNSFMVTGDVTSALGDYTSALGLDPGSVETYMNRASAHIRLGHPARAVSDYTRAIELDPGLIGAYKGRGAANESLGNFEEAKKDFRKARELEGSLEMKTPARR